MFLPETQSEQDHEPRCDDKHLLPDLSRYVFTLPIMTHAYMEKVIAKQDADTRGLVVLYHFYRSVRILLGNNADAAWWTHRRARAMESLLKRQLQL